MNYPLVKFKAIALILLFALFPSVLFAQTSGLNCSSKGYTIATINGVLTDEDGAVANRDELKRRLRVTTYNGEPLTVDFLPNPSHFMGTGDALKVVIQKFFQNEVVKDYDLAQMFIDASQKVKTQKLLLVAHSQGNFYANSFYDVATKDGRVLPQSLGVYAVASPSNHLAKRVSGLWLTSYTDHVIAGLVGGTVGGIVPPNIYITEVAGGTDPFSGHDFSEVYLKYASNQVVAGVHESLRRLSNDPFRNPNAPCITPPPSLMYSLLYKIESGVFFVIDSTIKIGPQIATAIKETAVYAANGAANITAAVAKTVANTTVAVASTIYNAVAGALSGTVVAGSNSAAVILATQDAPAIQNAPDISPESNPIALTEAPIILTQEAAPSFAQASSTVVEQEQVQDAIPLPKLAITTTETKYVSSGGGGGGGSTPAPIEQTPTETPTENPAEIPPKYTPPEVVDTAAPAISILGDNPAIITVYGTYTDAGATALDVVDGVRTVGIVSDVDIFHIGTYAVIYTASDSLGNTATSTRAVQVIADASEPTTTLLSSDLNKNGIADADESDVVASSTISLSAGEYHFNNLTITNNAVITVKGDPASSNIFKGVKIVATNITINSGSSISADGQGYSGTGPGSGTGSIAASYGGAGGGNTATSTYGSATKPVDLGSGVGSYRGGGAIRLIATGTFLNDGSISANGSGYRSSGGSIYITVNDLKGAGMFTAKGSDTSWPNSFAGGGGRIALHYKQSSFSGSAKANSGVYCFYGCNSAGGLGTVAFFDTTNNDFYAGLSWRFQKNDEPLSFNRIIISNGTLVTMDEGVAITANELIVNKATTLPLSKGSLLTMHKVTVDGGALVSSGGETIISDTLALVNSAVVTVAPMQTLTLSIPSVTIDASSTISATAKGDSKGKGFPSTVYGGGSYGGVGGENTATSTYGSAIKPIDLGSGGGAPHALGGGAIRLVVTDTLVNNGVISADGNTSSSGGSIYVTAKNVTGAGAVHANGGALGSGGYFSGPGGGGRIIVSYQTYSLTGKVEALGGCGSYDGWSKTCAENGTAGLFDTINNDLYIGSSWRFQVNDEPFNFNRIIISNGAMVAMDEGVSVAANELLSSGASFISSKGGSLSIPTVAVDGGTITFSGEETLVINTLTLVNNAAVTIVPERTLSLSVVDLNIGVGSSISVDSKGYGQSAGPGAGFSIAGASHGGAGLWNTATSTYGSMREPVEMGSGGNGYHPRGGGAIRLVVSRSLINNGSISAVGNNTSSGGSIYVTTNDLLGAGVFRADGGTVYCPNSCYGAGAGGRIAVYYQTSAFSGTSAALGAKTSYGNGDDGTVVVEQIVAEPEAPAPDPVPSFSSARAITAFEFFIATSTIPGAIDESAHTVGVTVPFGTDIRTLAPMFTVSPLATSSPASGVTLDFTNPVAYTVTAEDGSAQIYTVTVTVAPDTTPPDITPPAIIGYTFNGIAADITADFATTTPTINLALVASENVDWVSIKIEDQNDPNNYKTFFSGAGCVDGTTECTKSWTGTLSHGASFAPDSTYRIKVHIKDAAENLFQDYLSPYIITVNTVLP